MSAPRLQQLRGDQVPRTRKDLVNYLWFVRERHDCNLVKEGPFYASIAYGVIRATHERTIDRLTCAQWEREHFDRISA